MVNGYSKSKKHTTCNERSPFLTCIFAIAYLYTDAIQ